MAASLSSRRSNDSLAATLAGVAIGSAITLLGVWIASSLSNQSSTDNKKQQVSERKTGGGGAADGREIPADIRDEQLSRHTLYFGDKGMSKLKEASIVVVGVGGVGSHVAHMLGRAGVGHIRLIDFDQVTLSSLNRHACAVLADVGIPKVTCMKLFLEKICPDPNHLFVESIAEMYTQENGERLLQRPSSSSSSSWDIVIDAIDDVPTKAALLAHCLKHNIRVLSCMGAGGKSDVTRLHISDLRAAAKDPLASKLRQSLKKLMSSSSDAESNNNGSDYLDNMEKLAIIYSSEKPVVKLADFTPEQKAQGVHNYGAVDGMRIRILPVLGTMPAVMGQTLAAMALCELGGKPMCPVPCERVGRNVRHRMYQHLSRREGTIRKEILAKANTTTTTTTTEPNDTKKNNKNTTMNSQNLPPEGIIVDGTWIGPLQIDEDDVVYLLDVWRNRCAATGDRLGTVLEFVRWDMSKPSLCNNLVLLGASARKKFDTDGAGKTSIPAHVRQTIEQRLASCTVEGFYG